MLQSTFAVTVATATTIYHLSTACVLGFPVILALARLYMWKRHRRKLP